MNYGCFISAMHKSTPDPHAILKRHCAVKISKALCLKFNIRTVIHVNYKLIYLSFSVVCGLSCLLLDRRFLGSNPAEDDEFSRVIKIRSTTFFVGEGKPSAPCRKILRRVKIPAECHSDTSSAKFKDASRQTPASLLGVSATTRELSWINQE
jgi:hypothetical protein